MTALQQDVCDVMDAISSVGELMLLRGQMRTKTGNDLANEAYSARLRLHDRMIRAESEVLRLTAEVEGLRAQNAMMTDRAVQP